LLLRKLLATEGALEEVTFAEAAHAPRAFHLPDLMSGIGAPKPVLL
jgi:hypothetical protein